VEVTDPELVHLSVDGVGQSHGVGQNFCREPGGAAEAREVQRNPVAFAAGGFLNQAPPGG
jgi:hypothetical protein